MHTTRYSESFVNYHYDVNLFSTNFSETIELLSYNYELEKTMLKEWLLSMLI